MAQLFKEHETDSSEVLLAAIKMWIVDVLKLPKHQSCDDVFLFQSAQVKKVNVCGVVTACNQVGMKTYFTLDDATGSIQCSINYEKRIGQAAVTLKHIENRLARLHPTGREEMEVAKALSDILSFTSEMSPYQGSFKVGDSIVVCGFVTDYWEDRRLIALEVSNPLTEAEANHRIFIMSYLYKTVYTKKEKQAKLK